MALAQGHHSSQFYRFHNALSWYPAKVWFRVPDAQCPGVQAIKIQHLLTLFFIHSIQVHGAIAQRI
jgi:hypothetical protein